MVGMERQIGNFPQIGGPTAKVDMKYNKHLAMRTCLRLGLTGGNKIWSMFWLVTMSGGFNIHLTHATSASGVLSHKRSLMAFLSWSVPQVFVGTMLMALVCLRTPLASLFPQSTSSIFCNDGFAWPESYRMIEVHSGWRGGKQRLIHHPGWRPIARCQKI
jgi:hypothetical protein